MALMKIENNNVGKDIDKLELYTLLDHKMVYCSSKRVWQNKLFQKLKI